MIEKIKNKKGFSLVEAIIFSLIVVIVITTFYRTFASGSKVLRDARAKIAASQVANERLETLRNIPYDDLIDTIIPNQIFVTKSNINFEVITDIKFINDSYDNINGSDLKENDYKLVRIDVIWKSSGNDKKVSVYTNIAPPGTEELYTGGILDIHISHSNGMPVDGATVQVIDTETNTIKNTETTSTNGEVYLMAYDQKDCKYKITVRKSGYYDVDTMPCYSGLANTYYPVDVHASVVNENIWSKSITFDWLASLQVETEDPLGNNIGNIDFSLEGGRKLGDIDGVSYYSLAKGPHSTNALGLYTLENESAGNYFFEFSDSLNNANYKFWKMQPLVDINPSKFYVNPNAITEVKAVLISKNIPSLFIKVEDNLDHTPISEAQVKVENEMLGYNKTLLTDQFGMAYFPDDALSPIVVGQYKITVDATGYQNKTVENVDVTNLTEQIIEINAS